MRAWLWCWWFCRRLGVHLTECPRRYPDLWRSRLAAALISSVDDERALALLKYLGLK